MPRGFNISENQSYKGDYPFLEMYWADFLSPMESRDLIEWYDSVKYLQFDFQKEILDYICDDVNVLHEAKMKFRELMMTITSADGGDCVDPFAYLTKYPILL